MKIIDYYQKNPTLRTLFAGQRDPTFFLLTAFIIKMVANRENPPLKSES